MDRRSFLKTSAVGGGAALGAGLAAPALAQASRTLTLVTTWPRGFAGVHDSAELCANMITEMSDGQLTVDLKAANELVGALEVFDAVSSGQADMYHGADYYFLNQHPAYAFFTAVPFGMTPDELTTWYYHGGGREAHDELGQIFGLKSFIAGNTGAQAGGWFHRHINVPDDFNGLKFRMPGQGGQVLEKLGASVQNIPGGEVYQALSSGAIDGTEWIGPWADEKAGFQEITKIYYTSGYHEPGAALSLATNRDVFESLTPSQQRIIEAVAGYGHDWSLKQFLHNNSAALQRLIASGVEINEFPDEVWDAFAVASKEVVESHLDDEIYASIYDSFLTSLRNTSSWIEASTGVFTRQRNRLLGI